MLLVACIVVVHFRGGGDENLTCFLDLGLLRGERWDVSLGWFWSDGSLAEILHRWCLGLRKSLSPAGPSNLRILWALKVVEGLLNLGSGDW